MTKDEKIVKLRFELVVKLIVNKYYRIYFAIYSSYCQLLGLYSL